jgi:TRAP-type mannitol/chloroaromatic compound transport system permease small subunit
MFIYGWDIAWESLVQGRRSTSAWAPYLWISQIMVPIGAVLCGVQAVVRWIRDLIIAVTGKNLLASTVVKGEGGLFQKKEESA